MEQPEDRAVPSAGGARPVERWLAVGLALALVLVFLLAAYAALSHLH